MADVAGTRDLPVIDATCPLVAKVHKEGQRYSAKDYDIILIGHEGHPEVIGTMGRIPGKVYLVSTAEDVGKLEVRDPDKLAYVTQTTLSVDDTRDVIEALKVRFPTVVGPDVKDICYATQNRQSAVRELAGQVDLLLVVGAQNSSNSKRLSEIGKELNVPSYLIDDASGLNEEWLANIETVGITAGASAPEKLVQDLIKRLGELVDIEVEEVDGINENVQFKLPKELREAAA